MNQKLWNEDVDLQGSVAVDLAISTGDESLLISVLKNATESSTIVLLMFEIRRHINDLSQSIPEIFALRNHADSDVRSGDVRSELAYTLGELTSHLDVAIPILEQLAADDDGSVRESAESALRKLGERSDQAAKVLAMIEQRREDLEEPTNVCTCERCCGS